VLDIQQLVAIRQQLGVTQEQLARLLGVSFTSVNRWEKGHSGPVGPTVDIYVALDNALRAGHSPAAIRNAANNERGVFLRLLFDMAYSRTRTRTS
jgi:transcriptional regulator with XRE-family HTH domain